MWTGLGLGDGDGLLALEDEDVELPQADSAIAAPSTVKKRKLLAMIEAVVSQRRIVVSTAPSRPLSAISCEVTSAAMDPRMVFGTKVS